MNLGKLREAAEIRAGISGAVVILDPATVLALLEAVEKGKALAAYMDEFGMGQRRHVREMYAALAVFEEEA